MSLSVIEINKDHYEWCSLVSTEHIASSLGEPIELPDSIVDTTEEDHPDGKGERNLLQLFKLMKGHKYELVLRDNTYNHETDLDQFFVYSVYAPVGCSDWLWSQDCFISIEMGNPGDPRCVYYSAPNVYQPDTSLAETGFFDWTLGWYGRYLKDGEVHASQDSLMEEINNEISTGYTSHPTSRLRELCYADPIWVEKFGGYVARPKGSPCPFVFTPVPPCYL